MRGFFGSSEGDRAVSPCIHPNKAADRDVCAISRLWEIPGEVKIQSRFKSAPESIPGVIKMKFTFVKRGTQPLSASSLSAFVNIFILFSY